MAQNHSAKIPDVSDHRSEAPAGPGAVPMDGDAFLALLARRHSTRVFRDEPVPAALIERVVAAVRRFEGNRGASDDVTLIVARRLGD